MTAAKTSHTDGSDDPGGAIGTDCGHCHCPAGGDPGRPLGCDRGRQRRRGAVPLRDRGRRRRAAGLVLQRRAPHHVDGSRHGRRPHRRSASSSTPRRCGRPSTEGQPDGRVPAGARRAVALPRRAGRQPRPRRAPAMRRPSTAHGWCRPRATRARSRGASSPSRTGAQVDATILRVDGDTGTLSGAFRDGRFVLEPLLRRPAAAARGHARRPTGRSRSSRTARPTLIAARAARRAAAAIGTPTDPALHTP